MRRSAICGLFALIVSFAAALGTSTPPAAGSPVADEAAVGVVPSAAELTPAEALSGPSKFIALSPTRVLDTRIGIGATGALPPGGTVTLAMPGRGGVPATGATAVLLNVTVAEAAGPGFVQVFPTGRAAVGASSNLNPDRSGATIANLVVAPLGDAGQISVYSQGGGHLIADVFGYFEASASTVDGRYVPVFPSRILDTRMQAPGKLNVGGSVRVPIIGRGGVPATGASAVVVNVTATDATDSGYVQVLPTGQSAFGAFSNINLRRGQTLPNLAVVPVGADGSITVFTERGAHVIVDVFGYFTNQTAALSNEGLFVPINPTRLVDTRTGSQPAAGSITPVAPAGRGGIPQSGVTALFGNITATDSGGAGYVQVAPGPAANAPIGFWSNVNVERPGQTIPNAAIANLGNDATILLYTSTASHLLVDASGYFTGAAVIANSIPTLLPIRVAVTAGQSADINVLDYASDLDGETLTVASFTQPGDGNVAQTDAGTLRYNSYVGPDRYASFTVTVSDRRGASATTTVTVHITAEPAPPPCSIDYGGSGPYPAEAASLTGYGSAGLRCVNSGFRGSGYIGDWNGNQTITFTVWAASTGQYDVSFRYQNATETSSRQLTAPNGTTTMVFPNTHGGDITGNWANGSWSFSTVSVLLYAGNNTISLTGGNGFVDLDEITTITPTTPTDGLPTTPSGLTATLQWWSNPDYGRSNDYLTAQGQFQLQWTNTATNATGYRIYETCCFYIPPNTRTLLATVGANTNTAIVTATGFSVHHRSVYFEVVAFNSLGESAGAGVRVSAPTPNAPQITSYTQVNSNAVQVSWTQAPALGFRQSYFSIQASPCSNCPFPGEINVGPANYAVSYGANGVGSFTAVLTLNPSSYQCITMAAWYTEDTFYGGVGPYSPAACLSVPGVDPPTRTFQAEQAALSGSPAPVYSTENPGYTGSGYVGVFGFVGQRITFNVPSSNTAQVYLSIRERSVETGVLRRIYVNGTVVGTVALPKTANAWRENAWATVSLPTPVTLYAGTNTIAIEYVGSGDSGYADIDSITLQQPG
jgi:hypothetical protein